MNKIYFLLFAAIFIVYLWHTFITVYHFIRFGIGTAPKKLSFVFLAGSLLLFIIVIYFYHQASWSDILPPNFLE